MSMLKKLSKLFNEKKENYERDHYSSIWIQLILNVQMAMPNSQRYPWNLYLIHNGTLETFIWFTTVPLKHLSDLQWYAWNLYLIHNGTLETFIWFTTVPLKHLSDLQWYPWNLYLIHNGTLETFMWPVM